MQRGHVAGRVRGGAPYARTGLCRSQVRELVVLGCSLLACLCTEGVIQQSVIDLCGKGVGDGGSETRSGSRGVKVRPLPIQ